jgi:anti-sigma factor RsiW
VTCREFASFINDYLTGELPRVDRFAFERHLALCPDCERYLAQYRETIAAGRAAFGDADGALPPPFRLKPEAMGNDAGSHGNGVGRKPWQWRHCS